MLDLTLLGWVGPLETPLGILAVLNEIQVLFVAFCASMLLRTGPPSPMVDSH